MEKGHELGIKKEQYQTFSDFKRRIERGEDIKTTEIEQALKSGKISQEDFAVLALQLLEISAHIEGGLSDVARKATEEVDKLKEEMHIDSLTGLPRNVKDSAEKALADLYNKNSKRESNPDWVVLIALDLNKFKEINDSYGHSVGDEALRVFTERLKSVIREGQDLAFRKSGDEFFILQRIFGGGLSVQEIRDECYNLKRRINEKLFVDSKGESIPVEASLGYAFANKTGREKSATELMDEADVSLYEDKGSKARR